MTVQVQDVMGRSEANLAGRCIQRRIHRFLKGTGEVHVADIAARDADQVMVVAQQRLGQFETRPISADADPADNTADLQRCEVPVGRALRQIGCGLDDLRKRERSFRRCEHGDQVASTSGVAVPHRRQAPRRLAVDVIDIGFGARRHQVAPLSIGAVTRPARPASRPSVQVHTLAAFGTVFLIVIAMVVVVVMAVVSDMRA